MKKRKFSFDIIGKIALLKFDRGIKVSEKKKTAQKLLKEKINLNTVLEKTEKIKGRLRRIKTKYLAGEKTTETVHIESGCRFKLDLEKAYFSPRLSNERLEIAKKIKKRKNVLVMFSGIAPYSIIIGKLSKPKKVVSIELNRKANQYAEENILLNKLENMFIIQGDVKKVIPKLKEKFDYIVMPRPQLKDSFLSSAFKASKKGTEIFYYDFNKEVSKILERVYKESKKAKKKIKINKVKKAGEIAPYTFRWRVDMTLLN